MGFAYLAHAGGDAERARAIAKELLASGVEVRFDPDRTRLGPTLCAAARDAIAGSCAVVVLVTKSSVDDSQVRSELDEGLSQQKPVFPVVLDDPDLDAWWLERLYNLVRIKGRAADAQVTAQLARGLARFDRCPVISLMNMKGGVGKTTVASQVFAALQKARGGRVLLVDLDPQHNLTQLFFRQSTQDTLVYMDASAISLFEPSALQRQASPAENWHVVNMAEAMPPRPDQIARRLVPEGKPGRLDLVCGQFDLAKYAFIDNRASTDRARANFVAAIDQLRKSYDLIVLDTNPAASFLTTAALAVTTRIVAPVKPDHFSIRGVRLLHDLMNRLLTQPGRPPISILFNGVERAVMSDLETALRNGQIDAQIGFAASRAVLRARLPASRYLAVREESTEDDPLQALAIYRAAGFWAGPLKDALLALGEEIAAVIGLEEKGRKGKT